MIDHVYCIGRSLNTKGNLVTNGIEFPFFLERIERPPRKNVIFNAEFGIRSIVCEENIVQIKWNTNVRSDNEIVIHGIIPSSTIEE